MSCGQEPLVPVQHVTWRDAVERQPTVQCSFKLLSPKRRWQPDGMGAHQVQGIHAELGQALNPDQGIQCPADLEAQAITASQQIDSSGHRQIAPSTDR